MIRQNKIFLLLLILFVSVFINSCKKDSITIESTDKVIHLAIPDGWASPFYNFSTNTLTNAGFILGRKLFYEKKLSANNSISCGSCHQQEFAFSNQAHSVSTGIKGILGTRNAPALSNLVWQTNFMWNGGVNHIEVVPLSPITNHFEMNETLSNVINKLQNDSEYPALFEKAFGTTTITSQLMLKAMAQFTGMLVSSNSKYDLYSRGETTLTASETNGLNLFSQKCSSCHTAPLFTNLQYMNFGLDSVFTDAGRAGITGLAADSGLFKVPSLRNVALSYPYMHDGRFATLDDVLEHYSTGIVHSATLSPTLNNVTPLTNLEKQEIISFLNTLTDNTFITDERFKNPN